MEWRAGSPPPGSLPSSAARHGRKPLFHPTPALITSDFGADVFEPDETPRQDRGASGDDAAAENPPRKPARKPRRKKATRKAASDDTGPTDTGSTDTGSTDTGSTDTGSTDTGPTDARPAEPAAPETGPGDRADAAAEPGTDAAPEVAAERPAKREPAAEDGVSTAPDEAPRRRRRRGRRGGRKQDDETRSGDDRLDAEDEATAGDDVRDHGDADDPDRKFDQERGGDRERDSHARGSRTRDDERPSRRDDADDRRGGQRSRSRRRDRGNAADGAERRPGLPAPSPDTEVHGQRIAVLLDLTRLRREAEGRGAELSFGRLLRHLSRRRHLIRAIAYVTPDDLTTVASTLRGSGLDVRAVGPEELPVAMAVDAMSVAPRVDSVVVLPGDPLLSPLAHGLDGAGVRIETGGFAEGPGDSWGTTRVHHALGDECLIRP